MFGRAFFFICEGKTNLDPRYCARKRKRCQQALQHPAGESGYAMQVACEWGHQKALKKPHNFFWGLRDIVLPNPHDTPVRSS